MKVEISVKGPTEVVNTIGNIVNAMFSNVLTGEIELVKDGQVIKPDLDNIYFTDLLKEETNLVINLQGE